MTFTASAQNDNRTPTLDLVQKAAQVTSLNANTTTGTMQQNLLNQAQIELVQAAMNMGKLGAAAIISTCGVNVLADPNIGNQIAQIQTLITANPLMANALNVALDDLQRKLVHTAMVTSSKYSVSAAKILSLMPGGN